MTVSHYFFCVSYIGEASIALRQLGYKSCRLGGNKKHLIEFIVPAEDANTAAELIGEGLVYVKTYTKLSEPDGQMIWRRSAFNNKPFVV